MARGHILEAVFVCSLVSLVSANIFDTAPFPNPGFIFNHPNRDSSNSGGTQSSGRPGEYVYPHGIQAPWEANPSGRSGSVFSDLYANNAGDALLGFRVFPVLGQNNRDKTVVTSYYPQNAGDQASSSYQSPGNSQQNTYDRQRSPSYVQQPPSYSRQSPRFGQQAPSYSQQRAPGYNQQAPTYDQQAPIYNQQAPGYNDQPVYSRKKSPTDKFDSFFGDSTFGADSFPHIEPLFGDEKSSASKPSSDFSDFPQGQSASYYPIEVPSARPLDHHYKDDVGYPAQKGQAGPSPYDTVPYDNTAPYDTNAPYDTRHGQSNYINGDNSYAGNVGSSLDNHLPDPNGLGAYEHTLPDLTQAKPSALDLGFPKDPFQDSFPKPSFPDLNQPPTGGSAYTGDKGLLDVLGAHKPSKGIETSLLPREHAGHGADHGLDVQQHVPHHAYPQDVYDYHQQLTCRPEFFFEYDHDFSGPVYQEVTGQVHVQDGRAVFGGHGHIALPFFACNDLLPRYSMSFLISPSYTGGTQAIIGNSLIPDKASLLLSLTGQTLTLVIRQRRPNLSATQLLNSCYNQRRKRSAGLLDRYTNAGEVIPGFGSPVDGDIVVLNLDIGAGEVLVSIAQEDDWIFLSAGDRHTAKPGRLPTLTNEALYVGAGADPRGGATLGYYTGTFDSFLFEKCSKSH